MTIIQEILSAAGDCKAVVTQRRDGLYAVEAFRFVREESLDFGPQSAWRPVAGPALAAELDDALEIAWQQLETLGDAWVDDDE